MPRSSLAQTLQSEAEATVRARLKTLAHSMSLEDQSVGTEMSKVQHELLVKEILDGSCRVLWD